MHAIESRGNVEGLRLYVYSEEDMGVSLDPLRRHKAPYDKPHNWRKRMDLPRLLIELYGVESMEEANAFWIPTIFMDPSKSSSANEEDKRLIDALTNLASLPHFQKDMPHFYYHPFDRGIAEFREMYGFEITNPSCQIEEEFWAHDQQEPLRLVPFEAPVHFMQINGYWQEGARQICLEHCGRFCVQCARHSGFDTTIDIRLPTLPGDPCGPYCGNYDREYLNKAREELLRYVLSEESFL